MNIHLEDLGLSFRELYAIQLHNALYKISVAYESKLGQNYKTVLHCVCGVYLQNHLDKNGKILWTAMYKGCVGPLSIMRRGKTLCVR